MSAYKYVFTLYLSEGGQKYQAHPIYKTLSIEDVKNDPDMYFRKTIGGDFTFVGEDYAWIRQQQESDKIWVTITDAKTKATKIKAYFRYVDMRIDLSREQATTKFILADGYEKILTNLETEYDLVKLNPQLDELIYETSDMFQLVCPEGSTVTNVFRGTQVIKEDSGLGEIELAANGFSTAFHVSTVWLELKSDTSISGDFYEVKARPVAMKPFTWPTERDYEKVVQLRQEIPQPQGQDPITNLWRVYQKTLTLDPCMIEPLSGTYKVMIRLNKVVTVEWDPRNPGTKPVDTTTYTILLTEVTSTEGPVLLAGDPLNTPWDGSIYDAVELYAGEVKGIKEINIREGLLTYTLRIRLLYMNQICCRALSASPYALLQGYRVNVDDSYVYSGFYRNATPISQIQGLRFSDTFSNTPTPHGLAYSTMEGDTVVKHYYAPPDNAKEYVPFLREEWNDGWSLWIDIKKFLDSTSVQTRKIRINNKSFVEIGEAIKVLLQKIDPSVSFDTTGAYSEFLYDNANRLFNFKNGSFYQKMKIFITQKSNANKPNSDFYASKAPITLGSILQMLKEAFNLYWFIEDGKMRIEHVMWFMNGGTYNDTPKAPIDLSTFKDRFTKKPFSYLTGNYTYNISESYTRRKLEWGEESSSYFTDCDIIIIDTLDETNKEHTVSLQRYTPDVEYCAMFGETLSNDGFAVVTAVSNLRKPSYSVVVSELIDGARVVNGEMSMEKLFSRFLKYNVPGDIRLNDVIIPAERRAYNKESRISIPSELVQEKRYDTIKTEVGVGHISKMSIDLESGYATVDLEY